MLDKSLMLTALGQEKADLIIQGGRLVNVLTEEIYPADVAIKGRRIAYVGDVSHCTGPSTQIVDAKDKYLVPGLIDAHVHPEACKITMTRFAEAVVPRGTTTVFAAMGELWGTTGIEGVRFALDEAKRTPLRVIYHPYSRGTSYRHSTCDQRCPQVRGRTGTADHSVAGHDRPDGHGD